MGNDTSIGWTDATINLAWGCKKVSPGCANCYMYRLSERTRYNPDKVTILDKGKDYFDKKIKSAVKSGAKRIFINSMSDTFHEDINRLQILDWIYTMEHHPEVQFQILTKRANEMAIFLNSYVEKIGKIPKNIWFGVSIESAEYLWRSHSVRGINSDCIKFISFEPVLSNIFTDDTFDLTGINWIIIGGESDFSKPRPMQANWAMAIYKQAKRYNIPVFFKQMGGRGGDGAGGDRLNGRQIKEFPQ